MGRFASPSTVLSTAVCPGRGSGMGDGILDRITSDFSFPGAIRKRWVLL